jgi:hypothetical protein
VHRHFLTDFGNYGVLQIHDIGMANITWSESRETMGWSILDWHKHFSSKIIEPRRRKQEQRVIAW